MQLALAMLWMLGPLLMALFGKAVETLEGGARQKEVG